MISVLVLVAITPLVGVYIFSVEFINRGIDNWLNVDVERGMNDATDLAKAALDIASDCLSPPVSGDRFFAIAESSGQVRLVTTDGKERSIPLGSSPLRPIWDAARRRLVLGTAPGTVTVVELGSGL